MPDPRALAPTEFVPELDSDEEIEKGAALCLSGGGYRAMVFHVGSLWRLYDAGLLKGLKRISSVSGGSITAAKLALEWKNLSFDPARVKEDFVPRVVDPIRGMASKTIDRTAIIAGALLPGSISDRIADAYRENLFGEATLRDLPTDEQGPRFVINATNVQTGALWRFSRPYMGDWKVGRIANPDLEIAVAVGASSAFPPVLSPVTLDLEPSAFTLPGQADLGSDVFKSEVVLSDGGVYDNLGLETAWKRFRTVLVSDAGGKMGAEGEPDHDWARHSIRIMSLIDNQVRSLRKRQLISSYEDKTRSGAYWGIRTNIANYKVEKALHCPEERTLKLADTPTRLKKMDGPLQSRLINWGYAVTDAAIRRHLDPTIPAPADFPYPGVKV